ncbi:uncharacterized protein V6R79_013157 [Siganus canaliculatus]
MDGQIAGGSVFMCRLCNIFSPSRYLLRAHCSQLHPLQGRPDDIIIALQPLVGESVETDSSVKRKRGRPKGSKKKTCTEGVEAESSPPLEDGSKRTKVNGAKTDRLSSSKEGDNHDQTSGLQCKVCHRTFGNRRQILKHICLKGEEEEETEDVKGTVSHGARVESLDTSGTDPNKIKKKLARSGQEIRTKDKETKDGDVTRGNKKSVVSVVLAEDETLPGISKMVPVEDDSVELESATHQPQKQSDLSGDTDACEGNPKTNQETSSDLTSTTANNKSFQQYSIKQDGNNLLQSELRIFACQFCNKIFKFKHSLIAHLRTHTQEKPFQCPHCDYASAIKANLNVHLRKHTGETFSCPQCPFSCFSSGHLKVHIERVHLKVKQHCSFCEKKYSDVKTLLKHVEKCHDLKDPAVHRNYQQLRLKTRRGLRELLYSCPTCNRRFKYQLDRDRHLLVHGPQRPFACLICDHGATKMSALAAHVRKHLFLYLCSICDMKFVSSQKLKDHLREFHSDRDQEQAFTECINNSYYLMQPEGGAQGDGEGDGVEEGMREKCSLDRVDEDERTQEEGRRNDTGVEEWRDGGAEQPAAAARADGGDQEKEKEPTASQGESENRGAQQGSHEVLHQAVSIETVTLANGQEEPPAEEPPDTVADACTTAAEGLTQTLLTQEGGQDNISAADENTQAAKDTHTASPSGNIKSCDLGSISHSSSGPQGEVGHTEQSEKVPEDSQQSAFQQVFASLQKTRLNMESFQRLRKIYGDLECQYCGKLFWYKGPYNVHVRTHTKEHPYYCTKCTYSTITKSSLKRHILQRHSGLLLSCSSPDCKYTTPDKYKLRAHLRMHEVEGKNVTCSVCQQSFPEHRLNYHVKTYHPDTLPVQGKGPMVQRAEKCPYCDSYFLKNSSDFQRHIWAHQGLKPYACNMCDYAGRSRSNLKTHMNRHNTERHHLCDLCGKKFKSKVTLKNHRLSHTNEGKRFQCSECDFTYITKPSLLRHMEQHAVFKPFRCAHCLYSCNIAGPLKRHYHLKHPDQKYHNAGPGLPNQDSLKQQGGLKCPECEFVYGTKWELNRHLKSKHSLKVVEGTWEVEETVEAQYVPVEDEEQLTEAPVATLQDNVNIQQISEFSTETQNAVTSMVAMAPATVTVVQQVADEQEVANCSNQLMVVNAEGALTGDQVMVVDDANGLEALTVLTQGENAHHYIVYVQEHTVEIN